MPPLGLYNPRYDAIKPSFKSLASFKVRNNEPETIKPSHQTSQQSCPRLLLESKTLTKLSSTQEKTATAAAFTKKPYRMQTDLKASTVTRKRDTSSPTYPEPSRQTETSGIWPSYPSPRGRNRLRSTRTDADPYGGTSQASLYKIPDMEATLHSSKGQLSETNQSKIFLPKVKGVVEFSKQPTRWRIAKPSQLRTNEYCPNFSAVLPRSGKGVLSFGSPSGPAPIQAPKGTTALLLQKIRDQRAAAGHVGT